MKRREFSLTAAAVLVPAMLGAMMMLTGEWTGQGVFNVEQFNPDPFLAKLGECGLPWEEQMNGNLEMD